MITDTEILLELLIKYKIVHPNLSLAYKDAINKRDIDEENFHNNILDDIQGSPGVK